MPSPFRLLNSVGIYLIFDIYYHTFVYNLTMRQVCFYGFRYCIIKLINELAGSSFFNAGSNTAFGQFQKKQNVIGNRHTLYMHTIAYVCLRAVYNVQYTIRERERESVLRSFFLSSLLVLSNGKRTSINVAIPCEKRMIQQTIDCCTAIGRLAWKKIHLN